MAFAPAPYSTSVSLETGFLPHCAHCHCPLLPPTRQAPTMKSKRERRARPASPPTPSTPPARPPPRVDVDSSTLSVREQLRLARTAASADSEGPVRVRQRFRRKKGPATVRSGAGVGANADAVIPDGKYALERDPLLYIDAYNVIGAWPRLRKHRDRMDMDTARRLLLHDVAEYSHVRGWQCVVVFDAQGNDDAVKRTTTPQNVDVVFTGTETADSYIERRVFETCEEGGRQVWAATSDVAQLSFSRSKGAHVMSSTLFIQEIKRARRETSERVAEKDETAARAKMLIANVDEDTRNRLYELRDRLDGA